MSKKYLIHVNGTPYEVEVDEMAEGAKAPAAPAVVPAAAPAPQPTPAPAPVAAAAPVPAGAENVTCPMPGTILAVNVQPGAAVKKGDVMFILEAMKMENEIMAPRDGKVVSVGVQQNASVNPGDLLAVIE